MLVDRQVSLPLLGIQSGSGLVIAGHRFVIFVYFVLYVLFCQYFALKFPLPIFVGVYVIVMTRLINVSSFYKLTLHAVI